MIRRRHPLKRLHPWRANLQEWGVVHSRKRSILVRVTSASSRHLVPPHYRSCHSILAVIPSTLPNPLAGPGNIPMPFRVFGEWKYFRTVRRVPRTTWIGVKRCPFQGRSTHFPDSISWVEVTLEFFREKTDGRCFISGARDRPSSPYWEGGCPPIAPWCLPIVDFLLRRQRMVHPRWRYHPTMVVG